MKHHFDQYRFRLLKDASGPKKDPAHYDPTVFTMRLNALKREYEKMPKPPEVRDVENHDITNVLIMANAEHAMWRGQGVHTFIDPDTEKVIERAISKLDNATLARYRPKVDIGVLYRKGKDPIFYNYASDDGRASAINVESQGIFRMDDLAMMTESNSAKGFYRVDEDSNLDALRQSLRFTSGCFMMQECFPQVFVEGLPDFVSHPNWFKGLNTRSLSVDAVERSGVCPHIRAGHFRLLSSDRYVHKKGQVVFVKATMVKGKAKHTELEEINAKSKQE